MPKSLVDPSMEFNLDQGVVSFVSTGLFPNHASIVIERYDGSSEPYIIEAYDIRNQPKVVFEGKIKYRTHIQVRIFSEESYAQCLSPQPEAKSESLRLGYEAYFGRMNSRSVELPYADIESLVNDIEEEHEKNQEYHRVLESIQVALERDFYIRGRDFLRDTSVKTKYRQCYGRLCQDEVGNKNEIYDLCVSVGNQLNDKEPSDVYSVRMENLAYWKGRHDSYDPNYSMIVNHDSLADGVNCVVWCYIKFEPYGILASSSAPIESAPISTASIFSRANRKRWIAAVAVGVTCLGLLYAIKRSDNSTEPKQSLRM
jgi:hypothetical protein